MPHARVGHQHRHARGHRDGAVGAVEAVDEKGVTLDAHGADVLVHDAAGHAGELVLGLSGDGRDAFGRHADAGQLAQAPGRGDLEGGRGTQARAHGHVARHRQREALDVGEESFPPEDHGHARDIGGPPLERGHIAPRRGDGLVEACRADRAENGLVVGGGDDDGASLDGHGQDEPAAVIDMLADEVDATVRGARGASEGVEGRLVEGVGLGQERIADWMRGWVAGHDQSLHLGGQWVGV